MACENALPSREIERCPACGERQFKEASDWADSFNEFVRGARFEHPRYRVLSCAVCGLHVKSHVAATADLYKYYSLLDSQPFNLPYLFPIDKLVLKILGKQQACSKILDFGCSTGRLLSYLDGKYDLWGVEPNAEAANVAKKRNIGILSEDELLDDASLKFDLILISDVYEHLACPTDTLDLLLARLKQGGRLVIVTGYADSIAHKNWMGEYWYFRLYGHLHMLSKNHLDWLCHSRGLRVIESHVLCHYNRPIAKLWSQYAREVAYRVLRKKELVPWLSPALNLMPILRRARLWTNMPATYLNKDHVVAVLQKIDGQK